MNKIFMNKDKLLAWFLVALLLIAGLLLGQNIYRQYHGFIGSQKVVWSLNENGTLSVEGCGTVGMEKNNADSDDHFNVSQRSIKSENIFKNLWLRSWLYVNMAQEIPKSEKIQKIIINDGITQIGLKAFAGLDNLETVLFPSTLNNIMESSFESCGLQSVDIPKSVRELGERAFCTCSELRQVQLYDGLQRIGAEAFAGCGNLSEIRIPQTVTQLAYMPFANCADTFDLYMYPIVAPKLDDMQYNTLFDLETDKTKNITIHLKKNAEGYNIEPWTFFDLQYDIAD